MRQVPVIGVGVKSSELLNQLSTEVGRLHTLAEVLSWARRRKPPLQVIEIVTQDEYTHDVVMPFDGGHFLVFDAT